MRAALTLIISACVGFVAASGAESNPANTQCPVCPSSLTENKKTYDLVYSEPTEPDVPIFCGYATAESSAKTPDETYCSYSTDGTVFPDSPASCPKTTSLGKCTA
ncbi:hypothetical protein HYDPIDRAFT_39741 [Hydnomerulius pinastri MD-312]|uniref:Uncharacterized protein n=1 Tax=Hydnomerulius pinastri MD-312 TaxID=994086 RepID=A0A0C9WFT8_9AGAM|nr:hypothetical protein HYDPIDRAFT_39741 [Hydnomerulius pinastri MD-312]